MPTSIDQKGWRPGSTPQWGHGGAWHESVAPTANQFWVFNGTTKLWAPISPAAVAALLDHGTLTGLADDDHTQYVLANGTRDIAASNVEQEIKNTDANGRAAFKLTGRNGGADNAWYLTSRGAADTPNNRLTFINDGLSTRLTLSEAGGLSVNADIDAGAGVVNANTGFRVTNAAASGNVLRGNGTNFVSAALVNTDIAATAREIPYHVSTTVQTIGIPQHADETVANNTSIFFFVPTTWDGSTAITVTTIWFADAAGLVDLETEIVYFVGTDETAVTTVQAFTNSNLTWASANVSKPLTTSITPAAGRYYRVRFRRNTGDANGGTLYLMGARVVTATR